MFKNYVKTAVRNLLHNKTYSFINIVGLSLGLTCAMLIMLFVKDEVSYDRFHKNVERIYRIDYQIKRDNGKLDVGSYTGYFQGPRFAAAIPEIQSFVRYQPTQVDVKTGADIQSEPVSLVDSSFFSVLSFPLISGNPKTALTQPNSVVITQKMAKKYFGNADALGKTLAINRGNNFEPCIVTGVARDCPENSSIKFDILLPMLVSRDVENNNQNWFERSLSTIVLLAPNANVKATEAKMDKVFYADAAETIKEIRSKYGIKDIGVSHLLQPLSSIHLGKLVAAEDEIFSNKGNPMSSYILTAIATFILLIACINFINLTVARSVKRAKEIGIRKVVGGTRKQLLIQFLSESFILSLLAFTFAILLVSAVLPVFNQITNKQLSFSYLLDTRLVVGYVALLALTGLLAGAYPAAVLSNYNPVKTLYNRFNLAGKNYLQKALVVFQFALASFLIIGTITIFLQFNYLTSQKLGYDDSNLITVGKYGLTQSEADLFKSTLMKDPGIVGVAPKNSGNSNNTVKLESGREVNISIQKIDPSFLPLLKIPMAAGRNFSPQFPSDSSQSILVNEAFVREAGWDRPIGQLVSNFENGKKYSVVGVVKDYHYQPLTEKIKPQLFEMNSNENFGMAYLKIRPGTETKSLDFITKTFKSMFPLSAFAYNFKEQENARSYEAEAKWKQMLFFSALLTIFISCIGLFGLSVLSAEKRTKEIGVRKVLGASVPSIVSILSTDFLKLIIISLILSIPPSYMAATKWLQNYPYRIAISWWLFASAGVLVVTIALITVGFQSIKAAIANPVKSLRSE